ncbi:MAG: SDR family NAD(P)-dependent oxidoreductase [Chloroflexi bacterium]|nr:SDR family NAD(P)-dependent oxidoreductase [Chloroflexota bacterium]
MPKNLAGKVAVVTGSGRGIGRGIAKLMAVEGAKVVVNDFGRETDGSFTAEKVVEEIKQEGGAAAANHDSVATLAGGESIVKTAIDNFGRIDILVNVAGRPMGKTILELTEDDWDSTLDTHLKGHFACCRAAVPHMMQQKSGRIINFSSRGAFVGKGHLAYATAKAGVMGFTSALAHDLAPFNITVNAILPAAVTQGFPRDLTTRDRSDNMPTLQRPGPDFVAPMVVYLATDAAAGLTDRFFYASAGDICLYTKPFKLSAAPVFIRKSGAWTVDELGEIIPTLSGLSG